MAALFAGIACLRYELAIPVPEGRGEASSPLLGALGLALLTSVVAAVTIGWFDASIIGWLCAPDLHPYLPLIPGMVFLRAATRALNYWNTRTRLFAMIFAANLAGSAGRTDGKLAAVMAEYTGVGSLTQVRHSAGLNFAFSKKIGRWG